MAVVSEIIAPQAVFLNEEKVIPIPSPDGVWFFDTGARLGGWAARPRARGGEHAPDSLPLPHRPPAFPGAAAVLILPAGLVARGFTCDWLGARRDLPATRSGAQHADCLRRPRWSSERGGLVQFVRECSVAVGWLENTNVLCPCARHSERPPRTASRILACWIPAATYRPGIHGCARG
jgi:hypothetical protein